MARPISSSRAASAALCTTPAITLASCEPPPTGAGGRRESPSITSTRSIGVPVERVEVMLGDSLLPPALVGGGSQLANVMAGVVHKAALAAREELIGLAINDPASPFRAAQANTLALAEGRISLPRDEGAGLPIAELMRRLGREKIEVQRDTQPETARTAEDRFNNYATIAGMQSPTEGDYSRH